MEDTVRAAFGGAVVFVAASLLLAPPASAQVAPRIVLAFDTSGSMELDLDGDATYGDGVTTNCTGAGTNASPYCGTNCTAGVDTDCNGRPDDSRIYVATDAVTNTILAFGDVEWALARFPQNQGTNLECRTVNSWECGGGISSFGNPQCNTGSTFGNGSCLSNIPTACRPGSGGRPALRQWTTAGSPDSPTVCINYFGTCGTGNVLVGFPDMAAFAGMDNTSALLRWMDHRETNFINSTVLGNYCDHAGAGDCELRAVGVTPLAGLINGAGEYMRPIQAADPQAACRNYSILLLTDGVESCSGDPAARAAFYAGLGIRTYVVGLSITTAGRTQLNAIATAGGTDAPGPDTAFFANDPVTLSSGLAQVVADSLVNEVCNGADDDCDTRIDEGVLNACGTCGAPPVETCNSGDDDCDGTVDEGVRNRCGGCGTEPAEACNGLDDDCDGPIDEGVCGGCTPVAEACDGSDNDCDGSIDESLTRGCGTDVGACTAGSETCSAGAWIGCDAVGPTPEVCDGVDNDCDGVIDGNQRPCGSDVGECQAGNQVCTGGAWGACVGQVGSTSETCDGQDDDCDGTVDEGNPGGGASCGSGVGTCMPGTLTCIGGALTCTGGSSPAPETCDGADEDCDGVTDESVPSPGACGSGVGECREGALSCSGGSFVCVGGRGPSAEACNGRDDDCDASTDEGDPGSGTACGSGVGECVPGATSCVGGTLVCTGGTSASPEACNGLDDDCDGVTDESIASAGPCGSAVGECRQGTLNCSGGSFVCTGGRGPVAEACNGRDDDCDASTDEGDPGSGAACGSDVGACMPGVEHCVAGTLTCTGAVGPSSETCNGTDDDCDASVDEGNPGGGGICGTDVGECSTGTNVCTGGAIVCLGAVGPAAESCDALDNDCDSRIDEGNPGGGASCGTSTGECTAGVETCVGGTLVCSGSVGPTLDLCDGLDNDCDGPIDEGNPGGGGACGSSIGACSPGTLTCSGGSLTCTGGVRPTSETCNATDDDCDGSIDEAVATMGACGSAEGECSEGVLTCVAGSFRCVGDRGPVPEVCDARDNDCDAMTDEGDPGGGTACGTATGECELGVSACVGGTLTCTGGVGPMTEACDALDNDCDGLVDEGNPGGGGTCGATDVGECELGAEACVGGMLACVGATGPAAEICDGLDNDCDAMIDEGNPEGGVACGDATGECEPGLTLCTGGMLVCDGAVGPTPEVCDGLDNDCDGVPDDGLSIGAPCGTDVGECVPGLYVCRGGALVCEGSLEPLEEVCDALDNDCDGMVDEGLPLGAPCGSDEGLCMPGSLQCIGGREICVGEVPATRESCDCDDNDCDGTVDEATDPLCPMGSACVDCQCALPCAMGEFGFTCPTGRTPFEHDGECHCVAERCNAEACAGETITQDDMVRCAPDSTDVSSCVCRNNECTFPCDGVVCADGTVCDPRDPSGRCVERSCRTLGCADGEICNAVSGECEVDPCASVTCEAGEACREGTCEASCADVECSAGERCTRGECVPDACAGVDCAAGEVCDPTSGSCIADPCDGVSCPTGSVCAIPSGDCEADPCAALRCPEGELCVEGECAPEEPMTMVDGGVDSGTARPDGGARARGDRVLAAGGCMCRVGAPSGGSSSGLWLALIAVLALLVRRRRARGALAAVVVASALGAGGCTIDPFCLADCGDEVVDAGPRDGGSRDAGSRDAGIRPDAGRDSSTPDGCTPDVIELCNEHDDDCDGNVDEGIDLSTSIDHCGACGNPCQPPHAFGECVASACGIASCDVGFHDLDGDPANGCEYRCLQSEDDDSICDLRDNDCDGTVDEDVAFDTDPLNCGMCGLVCRFAHTAAGCESGACALGTCEAGFHDIDGTLANGCEYACTAATPPDEVCNARDDDCDGMVDEGDPGGGGACGSDVGECGVGIEHCAMGAITCTGSTAPTTELCNGLDEDCDGSVDESNPEGGALCGTGVGTCEQGRMTCTAGSLTCIGGTGPGTEACDGLDNDCDGGIDEGDPGGGGTCGSDTGVCAFGTEHCRGGVVVCEGAVGGRDETCDGVDEDCDGMIDEGDPGGGGACGTDVGQCTPGTRTCTAGTLVCVGAIGATTETCNGLDEDCDGSVDEGDPGGGGACGTDVGACVAGLERCVGGTIQCQGQVGGSAESCNSVDDDCDGSVDEGNPGGGASCGSAIGECAPGTLSCTAGALACSGGTGPASETCDGLDQDCDGRVDEGVPSAGPCGIATGECTEGVRVCSGGSFVCTGGTGPVAEGCDARDNDCDGAVDEGNPGGGGACGSDVGECAAGTQVCTAGSLVCVGATGGGAESCNTLDDDCDGSIDEGNPGGGALCGSGTGECVQGTQQCVGGSLSCVGAIGSTAEACDSLDNDCDGSVDEGNPGGGASCGVDTGACSFGTRTCVGGALSCVGGTGPGTETCNGIDDDCDASVDEGNPGGGALCGVGTGECVQGTRQCMGGTLACVGGTGPVGEACDSLDNDCDGSIDEGNPGGGASCGSGVGECSPGTQVCAGGAFTCSGGTGPSLESCNTLDDDCDASTDEDFDLSSDVSNCGSCGNACSFPNAIERCNTGSCEILACNSGFYDIDGLASTGCEYACSFNGAEVCNGDDDDCDGATDESLTPPSSFCNPNGVCMGTMPTCGASGWVCNYPSSYQAGGETRCDSADNDCDGFVDESFPLVGTSCSNGSGECRTTGTVVCNMAGDGTRCTAPPALPSSVEDCDDRDNDCDGMIDEAIDPSNIPVVTMPRPGGGVFDMFVYEASRPDATSGDAGDVSTVACSRENVLPWTNVTWTEANAACCELNATGTCTGDGSGWRLCDAPDWEAACEGPTATCDWAYAASCSSSQPLLCNGREYDHDTSTGGTQNRVAPTGSPTFGMCYADWSSGDLVFDLSGNVKEWTYTEVATGVHAIRGGSYNNVEDGRTCTFDFTTGNSSFAFPTTGFRCCRY